MKWDAPVVCLRKDRVRFSIKADRVFWLDPKTKLGKCLKMLLVVVSSVYWPNFPPSYTSCNIKDWHRLVHELAKGDIQLSALSKISAPVPSPRWTRRLNVPWSVISDLCNIFDDLYITCSKREESYLMQNMPRVRDSSVGTETRYGLDVPGIESRWGLDFLHPPRPAVGPTQPPIQRVPGLSRG